MNQAREKIALIFPKTKEVEFEDIEVPFSIFFVGSYLKQFSLMPEKKVILFDERITPRREIVDFIGKNKIKYVGISTMSDPQLSYAIRMSKEVRQVSPSSMIVWGGVHPTISPDSVIEQDYVDYVIRGEGEESFSELVKNIEDQKDVSEVLGVSFKKDKRVIHNLDRPFIDVNSITLDWSLLDIEKYIKKIENRSSLSFITSRGCVYRCKYCWNTIANKRTFRSWNFEKTIQEMKKITDRGIDYINFLDDEISIDKKRLFSLCEYFKNQDILWSGSVRIDFMAKKENAEKLYGCRFLFLGAESGSQKILDSLKKDIKAEDIMNSAHRLKEVGIRGNYSWMVGFPNETEEDVSQTLNLMDLIFKTLPDAAQRIRIYNPYPGTELYNEALKKGFIPPAKLEGWAYFSREYCVLGYIKDPWVLKCISYVSYFHFYSGKRRKTKILYALPISILKRLAGWRWRKRFFKFPFEYMLIEWVRSIINPAAGKYEH